ncbi:MAG TPA: hypothetical protein VNG93_13355 [Candidatus Dormibacteraeota bacterium]|nr:hypothetical protein [Candidatus Dormibacteraeota bacterium]
MIAGGLVAWCFGVNAERRAPEDTPTLLSAPAQPPPQTRTRPTSPEHPRKSG